MTVSTTETSETQAGRLSEAALLGQRNFVQLTRGYERFMKGLMAMAAQQIELSRGLMEGGLEDFNLLAQARTPDAFVQAEIEVFRRRSERAINAVQKVAEEMRQSWGEAIETAQAAPPAGTPEAAAKPAPARAPAKTNG